MDKKIWTTRSTSSCTWGWARNEMMCNVSALYWCILPLFVQRQRRKRGAWRPQRRELPSGCWKNRDYPSEILQKVDTERSRSVSQLGRGQTVKHETDLSFQSHRRITRKIIILFGIYSKGRLTLKFREWRSVSSSPLIGSFRALPRSWAASRPWLSLGRHLELVERERRERPGRWAGIVGGRGEQKGKGVET